MCNNIKEEVNKFKFKTTAAVTREYHEKIMEKVQTVVTDTSNIIGDISICYSMMTCFDPPSEDDENLLERAITSFSSLWRKLDINITPKAHYYEAHLLQHVKMYGAMGFDNEQIVERNHARENTLQRIYCNVKNETKRFLLIYERSWLEYSAFMKAKDKKLKEIRKQKNSNRQKLSDTTSTKGRKRFLELNGDDNNDEMEIDK